MLHTTVKVNYNPFQYIHIVAGLSRNQSRFYETYHQ